MFLNRKEGIKLISKELFLIILFLSHKNLNIFIFLLAFQTFLLNILFKLEKEKEK